jgi:hypothetical protein
MRRTVTRPQSFALGYCLGAFVATTGALVAILLETRRQHARINPRTRDVLRTEVFPASNGHGAPLSSA